MGAHGRRGLTAKIDLFDRLWYALSPIAGHMLIVAAAIILLFNGERGLVVLAIGTVFLLLASVRSAWEITSGAVMRSGSQ